MEYKIKMINIVYKYECEIKAKVRNDEMFSHKN